MFYPLKCPHSFIQNCYWITRQLNGERLVSKKMERKLFFSRRLKQFDGLVWPILTSLFYDRSKPLIINSIWHVESCKEEIWNIFTVIIRFSNIVEHINVSDMQKDYAELLHLNSKTLTAVLPFLRVDQAFQVSRRVLSPPSRQATLLHLRLPV